MPESVWSACSRSRLLPRTSVVIRRMSAAESTRCPSTDALTGLQAECDIGQHQAAIDASGAASHSPQPTRPVSEVTRTRSASWLPSPMSRTTGMER